MLAPYQPPFTANQPRTASPVGFLLVLGWATLLTAAAAILSLPIFPFAGHSPWLGAVALGGILVMCGVAIISVQRMHRLAQRWQMNAVAAQQHLVQSHDYSDSAPAEWPSALVDVQPTLTQIKELIAVVNSCAGILAQQRTALSAMQATRDALPRSTMHDPVTGAITPTALMTRLVADVTFAQQHGRPIALVLFDIDNFQALNALYGYHFGDEVLFAVAERIRSKLDEGDLFARLSADRFAVVRAGAPFEQVQTLVERILAAVAQAPLAVLNPESTALGEQEMVRVTMRAGVALCPDDGTTAQVLLNCAEGALGSSRNALRNAPAPATMQQSSFDAASHNHWSDAPRPFAPLDPLPVAYPPSYIDVMSQKYSSIHALTSALEAQDAEAVTHARNLAELAQETALLMGRAVEEARLVGLAALLHDVGNLGIPATILQKAEPLSPEEWAFVREHPHLGERLLTSVGGVLAAIAPIVASHRERWDGTGYPAQLHGESIPLGARIVAVCDVYGALISARPYRVAFPHEEAIAELQRGSGTQFDPAVVQAFIAALHQ